MDYSFFVYLVTSGVALSFILLLALPTMIENSKKKKKKLSGVAEKS